MKKGSKKNKEFFDYKDPYFFDLVAASDIEFKSKLYEEFLDFQYRYYTYLERKRSEIYEKIKASLSSKTEPLLFRKWQRVIHYKYSTHPLSTMGSVKNDAGGRFNFGNIDKALYAPFPALYISEDRETAEAEIFLNKDNLKIKGMDIRDILLHQTDSTLNISVNASLNVVFNINKDENLIDFLKLVKDFELPNDIYEKAKRLKLKKPYLITSLKQLKDSLVDKDWRRWPLQFNVPHNCQIFGKICRDAGIEAVLYKSKFTKKLCAATFPENFEGSSSYVELDGETPKEVTCTRLDSKAWKDFC